MMRKKIITLGLSAAVLMSAGSAFAAEDLLFGLKTSGLAGKDGDYITSITPVTGSYITTNFKGITSNSSNVGTAPKIAGKWAENGWKVASPTTVYGTGFALAAGPGNITIANGFSAIAAVQAGTYATTSNFQTIFSIYANQLQLAMMDTGELKVRRVTGYTYNTDGSIKAVTADVASTIDKLDNTKATVLSMTVKSDGSFNIWSSASGTNPILTGSALAAWTDGTITSLTKYGTGGGAGIGFGSGTSAGSSSWRGLIGDTYVYKSVLTDGERSAMVSQVQKDMGLAPVPEPGTILAALSILAPAGMMFRRRKA